MIKRNYKEKILNYKIPTGNTIEDFKLTPSLDKLLTNLDNGISTCMETARQSGRTLTSLLYASEILINEEDPIICIYAMNITSGLRLRYKLKHVLRINHSNLTEIAIEHIISNNVMINPSKQFIKRNKNKIKFIIYDDLLSWSNIMRSINLLNAKNILSVSSGSDPKYLIQRTGFKYFDHVKFSYHEDAKNFIRN